MANDSSDPSNELRNRIVELEDELQTQKEQYERQIEEMQAKLSHASLMEQTETLPVSVDSMTAQNGEPMSPFLVTQLSSDQIQRYSRQLLLADGFGVEGQCKLLSSSVLVVGAGGIGSTVLLYLAASGVGNITVVDYDVVEMSNLHRQVIHKNKDAGLNKAVSACRAMKDLNPTVKCTAVQQQLTHENALELVARHDCIVDASDNPQTRYLINDACVLADKPLVSGSAIGTEGQLTVYNHAGGPCYRCLYPRPNSTEGCKSCSDSGVLGSVPGLIGILQSLEVLKILTGIGETMFNRLLMYDSLRCSFMNVKKPSKVANCAVCGKSPTILTMEDSRAMSESARGPSIAAVDGSHVSLVVQPTLPDDLNISCQEYERIRKEGIEHILLDVRVTRQYEMCSLDGAINIPLIQLSDEFDRVQTASAGVLPVFCICRRGIASVEATRLLNEAAASRPEIHSVKNIKGGLTAWSKEVDPSFPLY